MDKFKLNRKDNLAIFSDFDGTISIQDVNNEIFKEFGDEYSQMIENKLQKNLEKQYKRLDMSRNEFKSYIYKNIEIDPYFKYFYKIIKENNIDFSIISGGFKEYIIIALNKANISYDSPIYANGLEFKSGDIRPIFLHDVTECEEVFGPCGNCKNKILKEVNKKQIIYIGDGLTDRCVADIVDVLFVKKDSILEKYCKKAGIDHYLFEEFIDIIDYINESIIRSG
jgi:2,3-diketo-5-methylthio-1-phosphopentane phosphatase